MQLSDAQRELLCGMTNSAYWEIRHLTQAERLEQGFELAAVFHQLLNDVWNDEFSLLVFRKEFLDTYQSKFPGPSSQAYLALVDRIVALENEDKLTSDSRAGAAEALT
jgi:hypothetical protein